MVASLDRFNAEAAKRAATQPNSPQLVRSAQTELVRLGCLATTVTIDGALSPPTTSALTRYLSIEGQPTDKPVVTQDLVERALQARHACLSDRVQERRNLEGRGVRGRSAACA